MSSSQASPTKGMLARYLGIEAASGLVLVLVTIVALVLANSRWAGDYARWLDWTLPLDAVGWTASVSVHAIVDEGLMAVVFFSIALELRRELHAGVLADARRAALPAAAALGGMVAPALLYLCFSPGGPAQRGWGVPMATDIALALAALALLGRRVAPGLRVLLLAIAILDDIGGVIVIAIFHSDGIVPRGLIITAIGTFLALGMRDTGVRSPWPYALPAVVAWWGLHHAGVHPTMAGVVMGLVTPPQPHYGLRPGEPARASLRSPSERVQTALHPWVAFVVMPLFAFANAGVALDATAADPRIVAGVLAGLVVGKPLGIVGASWIAVRLRLVRMPVGVGWPGMLVVGLVAGVGFTVALFIAGLAFADPLALASAKLGILGASTLAVVLAVAYGRIALPRTPLAGAAATEAEAEAEQSAER